MSLMLALAFPRRAGDLKARFKSYSKYPICYKDMAFWLSPEFSENNLCELVRGVGGDLVEEVTCIDDFTNPKTGKTSHCYRITYRCANTIVILNTQ